MNKLKKSHHAKEGQISQKWHVVNAEGHILGRLASQVAAILRGKTRVDFTPSMNMQDYVVIYNADKIQVTGNKAKQKMYYRYSGYPGGIKGFNFEAMLKRKPEEILMRAVRGMLPKTRLGREMLTKVRIYAGAQHPHEAQVPVELVIQD